MFSLFFMLSFNEFILKWPTLDLLSKTKDETILRFWSGLGYYSRASNLLKTAKIIKKNYDGKIPNKFENLINLPGIGEYTANAILGIAYNKSVMPLDANIDRILSRIYGFEIPLAKIKKDLKAWGYFYEAKRGEWKSFLQEAKHDKDKEEEEKLYYDEIDKKYTVLRKALLIKIMQKFDEL